MVAVPKSPPIDRRMDSLHPSFRRPVELWLAAVRKRFAGKYEIKVTETARTLARQQYLYGLGRKYPNPDFGLRWVQVTWTLDTMHRYRCALDWVPVIVKTGQITWHAAVFKEIIDAVPPSQFGLELLKNEAGQVIEWPHIQLRGGQRAALQAGIKPDNTTGSAGFKLA